MKKIVVYICLFFALNIIAAPAYSQCAMCTKAAEEATKDGKKVGLGLNKGILLLLSMPYIAGTVIGVLWWRNSRHTREKVLRYDD